MRRIVLALTASIAVHLGAVGVGVAVGLWRAASLVPAVKVQPIAIDVVKELPLGPPARKEPTEPTKPAALPRKPKVKTAVHEGVTIPARPDAGVPPDKPDADSTPKLARDGGPGVDGGRKEPGDLRKAGPEGSRLVALLRLDRLRASPDKDAIIAAVDQLFSLLPDRHWLIDGTGFDLYRDFDSLIIATPNPADATVTFLAVRHHLTDSALKGGLDRGAKALRKPLTWQTVDGRPVGLRQSKAAANSVLDRDDRIVVLPQPSLAIVATPAYTKLLLGADPSAKPAAASAVDGGSGDAGAGVPGQPRSRVRWPDIVARIDEQESAIPDDAVFMMMATQLFSSVSDTAPLAVPPAKGATDDTPAQPIVGSSPAPEQVVLLAGLAAPYLELIAELKTAADADRWERDIPSWKRRLLTNPLVLLSGFSPLIGRAQVSREGNSLTVRVPTTALELQRLLNLATNLARASQAARYR